MHIVLGRGFTTVLMASAFCAGAALAEYPDRPVKMIVPFPPGGSSDVAARVLAESMSRTLGEPVVVENRDGAGGSVGIAFVANSAADGYTVGVSGIGASILLPGLGQDTGFDTKEDLDIIGVMGTLGIVIAGRTGLEPTNFAELVAYAKAHPGELAYGTSGVGTPGHLSMALLNSMAGLEMIHIPYRGNTPLLNDVLGGHVDIGVLTTPGASEQIAGGSLVAYATTGSTREPLLPDVPTVGEDPEFTGYGADLWNLLVAPTGTPDEAVAKLSAALNDAMEDPAVIESMRLQSMKPTIMSVEEANAFFEAEDAKWNKIIADSGAQAE